jgi:hypothetical protein
MKCQTCQLPITGVVGDFDYTHLAGLRGKRVTLRDVVVFQCPHCKPMLYVEIQRLANLHEELAAAGKLRAKSLSCRLVHGCWAITIGAA